MKTWFHKIVALHAKGKKVHSQAKSFWKHSRTLFASAKKYLGKGCFCNNVSLVFGGLKKSLEIKLLLQGVEVTVLVQEEK